MAPYPLPSIGKPLNVWFHTTRVKSKIHLWLDTDQATHLRAIALTYYKTLSKYYQNAADEDSYCPRADAIAKERNQEIQSLRTVQQRRV